MSSLNWRTVTELRLAAAVVPNPNSSSDLLATLNNVNVAIDGGLLHIDPRQQPASQKEEYAVTVVPTSTVEYIRYMEARKPGNFVGF